MKAAALAIGLVIATAVVPATAQATDNTETMKLQDALKQKGHDPGPVDGVMGSQTSAALKAFQKEKGLSVTGRPDAATLRALEADASAPGAQPTGGDSRPSAVDPAQGNKTGANVGEGASYSRSTEKGHGGGEKK